MFKSLLTAAPPSPCRRRRLGRRPAAPGRAAAGLHAGAGLHLDRAYFGINAGYAYTEADTVRTVGIGALQANVTNGLRREAVPLAQDGFTAGGQVGYNYQFTPGSGIVVGLEADAATPT